MFISSGLLFLFVSLGGFLGVDFTNDQATRWDLLIINLSYFPNILGLFTLIISVFVFWLNYNQPRMRFMTFIAAFGLSGLYVADVSKLFYELLK